MTTSLSRRKKLRRTAARLGDNTRLIRLTAPLLAGIVAGCAFLLIAALALTGCAGSKFGEFMENYGALQTGGYSGLERLRAQRSLRAHRTELVAEINKSCLTAGPAEDTCEATLEAEPACQELAHGGGETLELAEVQGKAPLADPHSQELYVKCDQSVKRKCGVSIWDCAKAKRALSDFDEQIRQAQIGQAFSPMPTFPLPAAPASN
ncbi:MAG TPA: hypothetical protein VMV27_12185 [Candidatus Binataceae bacterium]|nr:hypothetical protein [Candidatus Binataceae bacterium]